MSLPANIRVNVRAPFPTQVRGAAFISVSKSNGVWTIIPDYSNLALNGAVTATQRIAVQDPGTKRFTYINPSLLNSVSINAIRTVTVAGAINALAGDVVILFNKSPSGASTLNLPPSSSRNGTPIIAKDITGDANTNNITIAPATGETIDGLSAAAAVANGIAVIDIDYGSRILYPLSSGGWYSL